jgi:hypothetical protein
MATLGPFVPKAFFVDGALPIFFFTKWPKLVPKKKKKRKENHPDWEAYGHKM